MSGVELLSGRRFVGPYWIPSQDVELHYLLAKKTLKGSINPHQERRIAALVLELGELRAEEIISRLFGAHFATPLRVAIMDGSLAPLLPGVRGTLIRRVLLQQPVRAAVSSVREACRLAQRIIWRTGYFVAVLGPDGAGKSTLLRQMEITSLAFRRSITMHWRPMLLGKRSHVTAPTGIPKRYSSAASVLRLLLHLADYWAGYFFIIRPALIRSSLVLFDRYADDIQADPARYGYTGPRWLLRVFRRLSPRPDLIVVLDAPAHVIYSRKEELTPAEIETLRERYSVLGRRCTNYFFADGSQSASAVYRDTHARIINALAERFQRLQTKWKLDDRTL
jgi:thymidylate kinase